MSTVNLIKKIRRNNSGPCVTLIFPTHRTSPERNADSIDTKHELEQVKKNIVLKYGEKAEELVSKLETLYEKVDFNHNLEGLGMYVSSEMAEVVHFPFSVSKKMNVSEKFHVRELIQLEAYYEDYFLLDISLDGAQLFRGCGNELNVIENSDFPRLFRDDYEYQRSQPLGRGHGYGLKNAEGDKSVVIEERFGKFLKETDKALEPYLKNNELLLLSGVNEELAFFQKVSKHNHKVAGRVTGSHAHTKISELGKQALEEITKTRKKLMLETIKDAEEAFGHDLAVTGIDNAWRAAREGKGRILLVEKDYVQPGFVKPNVEHLFLEPPAEIHDILDDAVESIIATVMEKDGKVMIVENEMLNKSQRIALLLRYP